VEALAGRARINLDESDVPMEPPEAVASDGDAARETAKERYALSHRELEVWLLLPEGLTNNQVGEQLYISGKTASVHVTHILRKLGLKTRVQAIALAHQLGLVDTDTPTDLDGTHE
jgi:DNA-binding NarL/FixJ family response regulator